jgi:hypothetical protein
LEPGDTVASVFSYEVFGDRRLQKRAAAVWEYGAALFNGRGSGESLKTTRAQRRGAQRLYENKRIDTKLALAQGTEFTLKLTTGMNHVVAMHDSSEIDLTGRFEPDDAGPLRSSNARGYMLHAVVLIDAELRVARGFVCADVWRRSWELKHNDQSRPPHRKESYKWKRGLKMALAASPEARSWIHVFDREGDLHENFEYAVRENLNVIVGARSEKRIAQGSGHLWSFMQHQPVRDRRVVVMTSNATGRREKRTLTIRAARVTLLPAKKFAVHSKRKPVDVNVVYVRGESRNQEWMLITTCGIDDVAAMWRVFDDYGTRTVGEDGFKLLKTGFDIEAESVESLSTFKRKIALLLPLATCLLEWRHRARSAPTTPALEYVDPETLDALKSAARWHRLTIPARTWTIANVVECLAQLGGYEKRRDQPPGWLTIWRGWNVLVRFREMREFTLREHAMARA